MNFENLEGGTKDPFACYTAGQAVDPAIGRGESEWRDNPASRSFRCKAEHIIDPLGRKNSKAAIIRKRMQWAAKYMAGVISVRPIEDDVTFGGAATSTYKITKNVTVSNHDLVIIATARPYESGGVAGYAQCLQRDQWKRCTVGQFNFCPEVIDEETTFAPETIESERHTSLHEIFHVLGVVNVKDDWFCNSTTTKKYVDSETPYSSPKLKVALVNTPRVLALARQQFDCPTLEGIPLENLPMGVGAHWEARVFGPEVMAYGARSGQTYVSDITLAWLEDSGHYVANYSSAGRLVAGSFNAATRTNSFFASARRQATEAEMGATKRGPGYLTWGREAGCDFLTKAPSDWPPELRKQYLCDANKQSSCTPDNRVSAVCSLYDYTPGGINQVNSQSCYLDSRQSSCVGQTCAGQPGSCDGTNGLPDNYQASKTPAGDVVRHQGGYNAAMDYIPLRIGYWNCQDMKPAKTDTTIKEGGMLVKLGNLFEDSSGVIGKGGQILGKESRCFISSLKHFVEGFDTKFTQHGLCYRANCATFQDLQFGLEGVTGEFWYQCPRDGGDLFIPGYTGTFRCPPAKSFCRFEVISGEFKPVSSLWGEWIMFGCIFFIPLFTYTVCKCSPRCRHGFWHWFDGLVGVREFIKMWGIVTNDFGLAEHSQHPLRVPALRAIRVVAVLLLLLGIWFVVMGVWLLKASMIAIGIVLLVKATWGWKGARHGRPGISTISFTYGAKFLGIPVFVFGIACFTTPAIVEDYVGSMGLPFLPQDPGSRAQVLGVAFIGTFIILLGAIMSGMIVLTMRVVIHANVILHNTFLFFASILAVALGVTYAAGLDVVVLVGAIFPGGLVLISVIVGFWAILHRSRKSLTIHLWFTGANTAILLAVAVYLFVAADGWAQQIVQLETSSDPDRVKKIEQYIAWAEGSKGSALPPANSTEGSSMTGTLEAVGELVKYRLNLSAFVYLVGMVLECIIALSCYRLLHEPSRIEVLEEELEKHPDHIDLDKLQLALELKGGKGDFFAFAEDKRHHEVDAEAEKKLSVLLTHYAEAHGGAQPHQRRQIPKTSVLPRGEADGEAKWGAPGEDCPPQDESQRPQRRPPHPQHDQHDHRHGHHHHHHHHHRHPKCKTVVVTLPEGAVPGRKILVPLPNGNKLPVEVPDGAVAGMKIKIQLKVERGEAKN